MPAPLVPIGRIHIRQGNLKLGEFIGLDLDTSFTLTNQGAVAGVSVNPATISASQISVTGLTTTGLGSGDVGYVTAANTVGKTDADALASSIALGVNEGVPGSMTVSGMIEDAKFTTAGGSPANGAPVFLATGTAEAGAAGKLSAVAPSGPGDVVVRMGICVDNASYAALKTCKVLLQIKDPVQL